MSRIKAPGLARSDAERWALALAAPITVRMGGKFDVLGGLLPPKKPGARDHTAEDQLRSAAGMPGRKGLLAGLPVYLSAGTNVEYAAVLRWHASLPPEAFPLGFFSGDQRTILRRIFVHDHAGRAEEAPLIAWDAARVVHYAGLGYRASFLSAPEAWGFVAAAADMVQSAYASWDEYAKGFIYGRWFGQGYWDDSMVSAARAIEPLLSSPESPFRKLPWRIDLAPLALRAGESDETEKPLQCVAVRPTVSCGGCLHAVLIASAEGTYPCPHCGEPLNRASADIWGRIPNLFDKDDDEEEEVDADSELYTNLDDHIERIVFTSKGARCRGCRSAIDESQVRAAAEEGSFPCPSCRHRTAVVVATAEHRRLDRRIRYVVGGPITIGIPDDFLYVFCEV